MIAKAAIVGGGVVGAGWSARLLLNGIDVALWDPAPGAERTIGRTLDSARRAVGALLDTPLPPEGALHLAGSLEEAVADASYIQESVPERLEAKRRVLSKIDSVAAPEVPIASSTSGFKPSDLQAGLRHPERAMVAHPFVPVYLLPLVELATSPRNDPAVVDRAAAFLDGLGMHVLRLRKEIDAHIADRLLEAVWREALWLVKDGVATTAEIDDAIRLGFGLRWAQMGLFETYRIAGGEAGMRHFLLQFGPCLLQPWSRLTDVPALTGDLVERIVEQSEAQSDGRAVHELEEIRDDNLVAIMRALKANGWGVGKTLVEAERRLNDMTEPP